MSHKIIRFEDDELSLLRLSVENQIKVTEKFKDFHEDISSELNDLKQLVGKVKMSKDLTKRTQEGHEELVRDWKSEKKDLEEAFDIIADKLVKADVEIEGLKARVEALRQIREEDSALLTKLCDALERIPIILTPPDRELVQRGRDAAR